MSLNLSLSNVFIMIRLGSWAVGKKITEVKCPSLHIPSGVNDSQVTSLMMLTFITWVKVMFVKFLHCKCTIFSLSLPYLFINSKYSQPLEGRGQKLSYASWRWNLYICYLEFFTVLIIIFKTFKVAVKGESSLIFYFIFFQKILKLSLNHIIKN